MSNQRTLSVQRLEGFYWVASTGGYAKAARAFPYPITQPGVFAQVRRLEEEVGARLFDRVAKDVMVPTRAGQALFAFCRPFFEGLPGVVRGLAESEDEGDLRIDAGALEMVTLIPRWVRALRLAKPKVRVRLREIEEPDYARLLRGDVDVIVEHQPRLPEGAVGTPFGAHRAYLALPASSKVAKRSRVTPSDLDGTDFVAFDPSTRQHGLQRAALAKAGVEVEVVATASSVLALLALVGAGLGWSLVVWPELEGEGPKSAGVRFVPLRGTDARFPILAAHRRAKRADLVAAALAIARG